MKIIYYHEHYSRFRAARGRYRETGGERRSHLSRVYAAGLRYRQRLRRGGTVVVPSHLRISEKYVSDEADRLFDHALKGGNGRNGIGSVYHWAETAGVKLDKQLAGTARSYAGKQPGTCELANLQPSHPLTHTCAHEAYINMPVFGNYDWPPFLNQLIDCGDSPAQRDILLLGAVTVLGATLNKHLRILYGRKYIILPANLIVAPPASERGAHLGYAT